jgi:peptidoglycan hydrolase-like protein with peptidoglycan-binding domain
VVLVVFGLVAMAVSSDAGCESDGDGSSASTDVATCDDAIVVQSASGSVNAPGDSALFASSESVTCELEEGSDDEEAVSALQDALNRCNGQNIAVDGDYGQATTQAVARVQAAHGLPADGAYGPATRDAMQWPAQSGGVMTCVSDVSASSDSS